MVLDIKDIILKPVLTEKSTDLRKNFNKYTFEINPKANKIEAVKAIEKIFNVKVLSANVINVKGKRKRFRNKFGYTKNRKKIIVTLSKDSKIDFFEGF